MFKSFVSRLISLLLVFTVFVLPTCTAETATDNRAIEPVLLSVFDQTASEWYESEATRALLSASVWMDIILSDREDIKEIATDAVTDGEVYVAKDGLKLFVFFFSPEGLAVAIYSPFTDTFVAEVVDNESRSKSSAYFMEKFLEKDQFSSYYEVDTEDILTCFELIMEQVNDD